MNNGILDKAKRIFSSAKIDGNTVRPPNQVFINPDLDFLLTDGGSLIDDEATYRKFISVLKHMGETEYYVLRCDNMTEDETKVEDSCEATFLMDSTYKELDEKIRSINCPPFGFFTDDFYGFGQSLNWGIYVCEYPTINIIGCTKDLIDGFSNIYDIKGNGFQELDAFITMEYNFYKRLDSRQTLIDNYKLV